MSTKTPPVRSAIRSMRETSAPSSPTVLMLMPLRAYSLRMPLMAENRSKSVGRPSERRTTLGASPPSHRPDFRSEITRSSTPLMDVPPELMPIRSAAPADTGRMSRSRETSSAKP